MADIRNAHGETERDCIPSTSPSPPLIRRRQTSLTFVEPPCSIRPRTTRRVMSTPLTTSPPAHESSDALIHDESLDARHDSLTAYNTSTLPDQNDEVHFTPLMADRLVFLKAKLKDAQKQWSEEQFVYEKEIEKLTEKRRLHLKARDKKRKQQKKERENQPSQPSQGTSSTTQQGLSLDFSPPRRNSSPVFQSSHSQTLSSIKLPRTDRNRYETKEKSRDSVVRTRARVIMSEKKKSVVRRLRSNSSSSVATSVPPTPRSSTDSSEYQLLGARRKSEPLEPTSRRKGSLLKKALNLGQTG